MSTTDRRSALYNAYTGATVVVTGVKPDQLSLPTPCDMWNVAALVDHLVGAGRRAAELGRGVEQTNEPFAHVELADAPAQLRSWKEEAEQAWADDSRLTASITMPWGEAYTGAQLVNMYLAELATHSWDLAAATGQTLPSDELAVTALDGAREVIRPEYRDAMGRGEPFGAEADAPEGASRWEQLAAFMGRASRPSLA